MFTSCLQQVGFQTSSPLTRKNWLVVYQITLKISAHANVSCWSIQLVYGGLGISGATLKEVSPPQGVPDLIRGHGQSRRGHELRFHSWALELRVLSSVYSRQFPIYFHLLLFHSPFTLVPQNLE